MQETKDLEKRLKAEAAFQNRRVQTAAEGGTEARDRFYYLADSARRRYHACLEKLEGKQVLIVGCSEGGVTPMARAGAIVTGIDIADEPIRRLNEVIAKEGLAGRARGLVMNAETLDFQPASFDCICCAGVLHHLDVEKAAASWARCLKPDGFVAMLEPMAWHPIVALYRRFTPSMRTRDEHPLKPRDFKILRRHFASVKVQGYVLTSVLSLVWAFLPNVLSLKEGTRWLFERLDALLLRLLPPLRYFCWTSVIRLGGPRPAQSS
ncbi:MAG: methyltransferase domain-containing protein [Planctomycetaceae bacterium]